jgi:methyl-accepting chemotaxis protein
MASDDLSRRTENQAASLEQAAAALGEITSTVRRSSEGAIQAKRAVNSAKTGAEQSGVIVSQAVSAMSEIESSSRQITQIIGVIDEIAFQTNLLALNAGVEAARAGDAGRGFAVVASEVRALAQRSAEAAKEIKGLISESSRQVAAGVDLVGQTGQALKRIVEEVAEINDLVSQIAASAEEQSIGLQEVNTTVVQMDQVTQQNAAMVEQSTAASRQLADETTNLQALIGRFNYGEVATLATSRAPSRPAARPAPTFANRAPAAPAPVRKPAPSASDEGWEEF